MTHPTSLSPPSGSILRMRRPKDYIPGWEPDHVILTRLIPGYRIPISREVRGRGTALTVCVLGY